MLNDVGFKRIMNLYYLGQNIRRYGMNQYDLDKQHQKGKLHAIERIHLIMDEGSFTETYIGPGSINAAGSAAYDGVITGFGKIKRKKVYIYSQDFTVKGGTIGLNQGFKIARTI